ncbi:phospholipid scramblase 2-like [Halichondria panicea]|uniref:phospholipid scramblase 2-like n=1 Tax=Halichondria panicea TaxID=6063 RepID=UPI00312BB2A3
MAAKLQGDESIDVLHRDVSEAPSDAWMPAPQSVPSGCPPGLEYLTTTDQVIVHQIVEVIEAVSGFETKNMYKIKNAMGQTMYSVLEESTCVIRQCCGHSRPFELAISNGQGTEVMRLVRPFRCDNTLGFCCLQELEVQCPPGETIGWIKQNCSLFSPRFSVTDASGQVVYRIKGPCFSCKWCDVEFRVTSSEDNEHVGTITKQWSGLSKEYFSDADNFGILFPSDTDVKMKAILIGAVFLIDFMYFEN